MKKIRILFLVESCLNRRGRVVASGGALAGFHSGGVGLGGCGVSVGMHPSGCCPLHWSFDRDV